MQCGRRVLGVVTLTAGLASAQAPVSYRIEFSEAEHRWAQVEIVFPDLPPGPLEVRMSRTSPGRYALHEFAKNVYDVRAFDGSGRPLTPVRPNPHQWNVMAHDGTVRVDVPRVRRPDRRHLPGHRHDARPSQHAGHVHVGARARRSVSHGFDSCRRPVSGWRVATQLFPTDDPLIYTAPNLQYFLDSPTELSDFTWRTFTISAGADAPTFRIALHHRDTDAQADAFARDTEKIVREAEAVYGEFPAFDTGTYTFSLRLPAVRVG